MYAWFFSSWDELLKADELLLAVIGGKKGLCTQFSAFGYYGNAHGPV
jgi:hypothetical protein